MAGDIQRDSRQREASEEMPISIIAVGRAGERCWREAADEYLKRISRYERLSLSEVPAEPEPRRPNTALCDLVKKKEADAILRRIDPEDVVIALCPDARQLSSEEFARFLEDFRKQHRRLVFVIGGSLGIGEAVLARAQRCLSLSRMTFPHQLARIVLLEQIYRACRITAGERYHK